MQEITLGWDFANHQAVVLVDRVFDFTTDQAGQVITADITLTEFVRPGIATLLIGLCLFGLWRLGAPSGRAHAH
ncbi:MAG TPA: hypothetical protein VMB21_07470 [Candidatus Limnocylindria bacterium]|jgi:hypothetical protein|nr:hypothetical protein [Candidatus Limnocylindria bacterium]